MDKEEAFNKLWDYIKSIKVDEMFYKTTTHRDMIILNIERQIREYKLESPKGADFNTFKIGEGEQGVFIFYRVYVGYYCYDYGFNFRIPTNTEIKPYMELWPPETLGDNVRVYDWASTADTYDITSLVMKTSQMPYMNWRKPPF